ncbi:MAG TPA: hypothetical protein VK574_01045 [Terracidiphilus sp.]|nr:hypothetical protein [Terracidiphilus sp.]
MDRIFSAVAALAMGSPFLAILLILAYYYLFRVPWGRKRKRAGRRSTFLWSTAGLGTVLLGLTLFYRPRLQFAVEAQHRQVEDVDEDDNGDPDIPSRHLMRQLRRIRRGEEVESLSVRRE